MKHNVTLTRHPRGPLDPHHVATCTCGLTSPPMDLDEAKAYRRRHLASVAVMGVGR